MSFLIMLLIMLLCSIVGGLSSANNRILKASVVQSGIPRFYDVYFSLESTDPANYPLNGYVIFFLHDSFSPSVYSLEVINGKAEDEKKSYEAFTIGAIADDGQTLLEFDLSKNLSFPREFREL